MKKWFLILCLCSLIPFHGDCQLGLDSTSYKVRPKIGLVFSGGVAHGLAHIGVLKYLEENEIPIDYITGTSMGAIVGGLKAMGMNAADITNEVAKLDWSEVLYNKIALNRVSSVEKFYHEKLPVKLIVDRKGIRLPLSLVGGHNLDLVISAQYAASSNINSFDDLPIPFRCIATDIVSGDEVILSDGYLGRAIRSSMSMPLIFRPVQHGDKLLVDGGLVRNYPVEEVRDMGADIVIGCDVGYKLLPGDELVSSLEILYQAGFMSMHKDAMIQKEKTNIHIEPIVKAFSIFGFEEFKELIELGYNAAEESKEDLLALKRLLERFPEDKKYVDKLALKDSLDITEIAAIDGNVVYTELIKRQFDDGKSVKYSIEDIERRIHQIYGTKNFSSINYSFEGLSDGSVGLNLYSTVIEESALGVNVNYFGMSKTSLIVHLQLRNKMGNASRFNFTSRISNNSAFQFNYLKRFLKSKDFYFSVDGKLEREEFPIYLKNEFLQQLKRDIANTQFHLGVEAFNNSRIEAFYRFQNEVLTPRIFISDYLRRYESNHQVVGLSFDYNSKKSFVRAKKGWSCSLELARFFGGESKFDYTSQSGEELYPIKEERNSILLFSDQEFIIKLIDRIHLSSRIAAGHSDSHGFRGIFRVGGTQVSDAHALPFIGKFEGQLSLKKFAYYKQQLDVEIYKNWDLSLIGNIVYGQEALPILKDGNDGYQTIIGGGVALSYKSPLGPIVINLGFTEDGLITDFGMGHKYIF